MMMLSFFLFLDTTRPGFRRDRFQVVFPQIYVHSLAVARGFAPQLARIERDRVTMLRLRPCVMRVGVGENEYSPVARDDASLAARIARQTSVSNRIQVARADAITFGIARTRRFGFLFVF